MNHDLNRRQLIFLGAALAGAGIYDAGEKVVKPKNFLLMAHKEVFRIYCAKTAIAWIKWVAIQKYFL